MSELPLPLSLEPTAYKRWFAPARHTLIVTELAAMMDDYHRAEHEGSFLSYDARPNRDTMALEFGRECDAAIQWWHEMDATACNLWHRWCEQSLPNDATFGHPRKARRETGAHYERAHMAARIAWARYLKRVDERRKK